VAVDNTSRSPRSTLNAPAKPWKTTPEEIRKIAEAKLAHGQRVSKKHLAALIGKSIEAIRLRKKNQAL